MQRPWQSLALLPASFSICAALFLLDHEIRTLADLLDPSVWPAFPILGLPLWMLLSVLARFADPRRPAGFWILAASIGLLVGGLAWLAGSTATTTLGQVRNLGLLTVLATGFAAGSVATVVALLPSAGRGPASGPQNG
ncbi:MAG: hypothetical protein MI919_35205 [Holophagales bacterium]|nr:hypothetical protein [Holophagales bacterium]